MLGDEQMWKTLLGRCIYRNNSGISIYQNAMFRWLKFNSGVLQTLLNRYYPSQPGLYYIKPLILAVELLPGTTCMLGLGGAGVAHALAPSLDKIKLTIIEKDPVVIELAKHYFRLDKLKVSVVQQDAFFFLQKTQTKYKHLLIDLFGAKSFPKNCFNEQFFRHCKTCLTPDGILAINIANYNNRWPILQLIRQHFHQATLIFLVKKSANIIILASSNTSILPLLEILQKSNAVQPLYWDAKWGWLGELL